MREILFRGQTRSNGEQVWMNGEKVPGRWVYGGVLQGSGDHSIIYGGENADDPSEWLDKWPVYTDTLGQYTGLKDKNGKRIFEGDIVSFEDAVADYEGYHDDVFINHGVVIIFPYGGVSFSNRKTVEMDDLYDTDDSIDAEVIGNIHDNPELMKKEDK